MATLDAPRIEKCVKVSPQSEDFENRDPSSVRTA